jgi:hypothetical protein
MLCAFIQMGARIFVEIVDVHSENHREHINKLCAQNEKIFLTLLQVVLIVTIVL